MNRRFFIRSLGGKALGLAGLGLAGTAGVSGLARAASDNSVSQTRIGRGRLRFDVAESGPKFSFDEAPLLDSGPFKGLPAYGNAFVTQGFIYPFETLDGGVDGAPGTGIAAGGGPEFPALVIGEWTCRGYFIGNGVATETGPWVITTQHYDFYDEPGFQPGVNQQSGNVNLVSDGYELVDIGRTGKRAITGGTGPFRYARGEVEQVLLGFNASEGVVLRFDIRVR